MYVYIYIYIFLIFLTFFILNLQVFSSTSAHTTELAITFKRRLYYILTELKRKHITNLAYCSQKMYVEDLLDISNVNFR